MWPVIGMPGAWVSRFAATATASQKPTVLSSAPGLVDLVTFSGRRVAKAPPLIKPPALKPGDTIALVTPATGVPAEEMDESAEILEAQGFKVKRYAPNGLYETHFVSASDEARARALNRAFADPEVKAIFAVIGGSGTYRPYFLQGLDWELIRKNPKIITGFSDNTFLLNAIHKHTGLVVFHTGFPDPKVKNKTVIESFWHVLSQPAKAFTIHKRNSSRPGQSNPWIARTKKPYPKKPPRPYTPIVKGVAEGRLAGGNLSTIASTIGTPYQPDFNGKIVFLEDWYSDYESLDRWFAQLVNSGMLNKARAVILGEFHRVDNQDMPWGKQFREFMRFARERGIPIGINFPIGHGRNNYPMPIGIRARFDSRTGKLTFLESPTRPSD